MHNILLRQIDKYLPKELHNDARLKDLFNSISLSYNELERQKTSPYITNGIESNGDNKLKDITLEKLQEIILNLNHALEKKPINRGDILELSDFISQQIKNNRKNEIKLKKSNNLFKTLMANLHSGVLVENEHRQILFTNSHFCEMFQIPHSPDDLVGADCTTSAEQSKHLFKQPELFVASINKLLKDKKTVYNQLIETVDGRFYERDYIPIFVDNIYAGHLWQYKEITERVRLDSLIRESEELNRLIMDNAMDGITIADEHGHFIYWNPAAEKLFGWKKEQVLGLPMSQFIIPEHLREAHEAGMNRYTTTGISRVLRERLELPALKADGTEFSIEMYIIAFRQNNKQLFCAFIKDITTKKIQEEKLKYTTQKLESIFNEMTDVVYSIKVPTMELLFITPSVETIFEMRINDFLKDTYWWKKIIYEEDLDVLHKIKQSLKDNNEFNVNYRIKTPSGIIKWITNKAKFILDKKQNPIRLDGVVMDRTSQYQAQENLAQEVRLQEALIDIASTYINLNPKDVENVINLSLQKMGKFVSADRAYIFDYDFDNDSTSNTYEWCSDGITPEIKNLQEVPISFISNWIEQHRIGEPFYVPDVQALPQDGDMGLRALLEPQGIKSLIAIPMRDGDELIGFVGFDSVKTHYAYSDKEKRLLFLFGQMLINIRNRQKWEYQLRIQEEKYRNIIANMNLGLLEVDLDDVIIYANQTFCQMSGYSLEELKNKKAAELFVAEETRHVIYKKNIDRISSKSDGYELEVTIKTSEKRWWFVSGAPNYNDKGQLIGSIGIHLDITQQKQLEVELAKAKSFAEAAAKAKELFLANMSHEIRTPLNVIIGMIRQLTKDDLTVDQQFYVKQSESSAKHLLTILNNVLDIAKIESGDMEILAHPFSLSALLYNVHSIMFSQVADKNLEFKVNVSPQVEPVLLGDDTRLRQVLINLIGNTIKFTNEGSITINAEVKGESADMQTILFEVADTGIGMSEDFVSIIFDKFSQEQNELNRKYEGTGLGMAISYDLIKLMNGHMKVESKKHKGTKISFELSFPIGNSNQMLKKSDSIKEGSFKGMRALLVEDNEMNRFIAKQSLSFLGFETIEAENGEIAVALTSKNSYDIILMDIQMPVMDGVEATVFMREVLKLKTPIIALTANAFKHDIELYLSKGMNDFITKPYDEQDFFRKIENVVLSSNINSLPIKNVTNQHPLVTKNYDLSQLIAISRDSDDFVNKMVTLFVRLAKDNISLINQGIEIEDFDSIKRIAHKIKPSIDQLGITSLKDVVRKVEKFDEAASSKSEFIELATKIVSVLKVVIIELEQNQH